MYIYDNICPSVLLRMRNISDESSRENQSAHFMFNIFFPDNHDIYDIMWKKHGIARQATDDNIKQCMSSLCWVTKDTDTHSACVIYIAYPREQWLHKHV
jgi:hypothetical protein